MCEHFGDDAQVGDVDAEPFVFRPAQFSTQDDALTVLIPLLRALPDEHPSVQRSMEHLPHSSRVPPPPSWRRSALAIAFDRDRAIAVPVCRVAKNLPHYLSLRLIDSVFDMRADGPTAGVASGDHIDVVVTEDPPAWHMSGACKAFCLLCGTLRILRA